MNERESMRRVDRILCRPIGYQDGFTWPPQKPVGRGEMYFDLALEMDLEAWHWAFNVILDF